MRAVYISFLGLMLAAPQLSGQLSRQMDGDMETGSAAGWDGSGGEYLPQVDSIPGDWSGRFATDAARHNFKQLREYRVEKQAALLEARSQLAAYQTLMAQVRGETGSSADHLSLVRDLLSTVSRDTTIAIQRSLPYDFDLKLGYSTPGIVPVAALRDLQRRISVEDSTAKRREATIVRAFRLSKENIRTLEGDLRRAEAAIDAALAPEIRSQQFRTWVSAFFSALIAVMIISFFATIYLRSGNNVGSLLLSDSGLQFVTIFVLIIAIILFGILNILEGRELAAILSGIAGYILGRGSQLKSDASAGDSQQQPPASPAIRVPGLYIPPADAQPSTAPHTPSPPPSAAAEPVPATGEHASRDSASAERREEAAAG